MPGSKHTVADSNKQMAALVKQRKSKSRSKQKQRRKKKSLGRATSPIPKKVRRSSALEYLHLWETDRDAWSFKKKLQFWLLNNMYDKKQIRKSDFKVLVKYLEGLQGYQRKKLVQDAEEIVQKYRLDRDEGDSGTIRVKYKRAVKVLFGLETDST